MDVDKLEDLTRDLYHPDPFAPFRHVAVPADGTVAAAVAEGGPSLAGQLLAESCAHDEWDTPGQLVALLPAEAATPALTTELLAASPADDPDQALAEASELAERLTPANLPSGRGVVGMPVAAAAGLHPAEVLPGHYAPQAVVGLLLIIEGWIAAKPSMTVDTPTGPRPLGDLVADGSVPVDERGAVEARFVWLQPRDHSATLAYTIRGAGGAVSFLDERDGKQQLGGLLPDLLRRSLQMGPALPAADPLHLALTTYLFAAAVGLQQGYELPEQLLNIRPDRLSGWMERQTRLLLERAAARRGVSPEEIDEDELFGDLMSGKVELASQQERRELFTPVAELDYVGLASFPERGWALCRLLYQQLGIQAAVRNMPAPRDCDLRTLITRGILSPSLADWLGDELTARLGLPDPATPDHLRELVALWPAELRGPLTLMIGKVEG